MVPSHDHRADTSGQAPASPEPAGVPADHAGHQRRQQPGMAHAAEDDATLW